MVYFIALITFSAFPSATGAVRAQDLGAGLSGAVPRERFVWNAMLSKANRFDRRTPKAPTFSAIMAMPGVTSIALTAVLRKPHRNMPDIILADGCHQRLISTRLEPPLLSTKRSPTR